MFCRNCGKELNDDAVFCNGCGTQLKTADPAEQVTAPMPTVQPYDGQQVAPPVAPPVPVKRSNTGLIVALVLVGVLVVGGAVAAGLFMTGAFDKVGVASSRTDEGAAKADGKTAGDDAKTGTSDDADNSSDDSAALTDDESYDVLALHYATLSDLADEIGRANSDGTYGGTGFAYDTFNPAIGSQDLGIRNNLVDQCQELLDTVSGQKQGLDEAQVSAAYQSQKSALLDLYGLLEKRVNAMLGAAEAAVDDPSEASWRPILSPASTDSREAFEASYPGAAPARH